MSDKPTQEELDNAEDYIAATIGEGTAKEFVAYVKLQRKIDLQDIFKNPKSVKEIKEVDMQYALIGGLTEIYKKDKEKYLPKIAEICVFLRPEFATLLLRLVKATDVNSKDEKFFMKHILQTPARKEKLKNDFEKYLLG